MVVEEVEDAIKMVAIKTESVSEKKKQKKN